MSVMRQFDLSEISMKSSVRANFVSEWHKTLDKLMIQLLEKTAKD
jgi:hypothetical protein